MHTNVRSRWLRPVLGLGLVILMPTGSLHAQDTGTAATDSNLSLLDTLLENGAITRAQYNKLRTQEQQRHAARAQRVAAAPAPAPAPQQDKDFTMKIGGRIQTDAMFAHSDRTPLGDGQEIRRFRFDIKGKIYHDWAYSLSYDFASSDEIKNANLSYVGFKDTDLIFGYYKQPYSLEYQTSNKALEFQERAMLDDSLDPAKRIGIGVFRHSTTSRGEYTAAAGVFGQAVPADTDDGRSSGIGVSGRLTYAFVHTNDTLLHIGASGVWRHPGHGETQQLTTRPDAHQASRLIDTGVIPGVDHTVKLGGEFVGVTGPLAVQGEYMTESLKRQVEGDLHFHGWYVQGSYFLTDDSRAAAYDQGSFGTIKPSAPGGAWQLAMRYDTLDLIDGGFNGGRESNLTAALNWYVNKYLRFSMNYVKVVKLDRPGNVHDEDKPSMLIARMWIGF